MPRNGLLLALAASLAAAAPAYAAEGTVTWHDPTCGYFVLSLPEHDRPERFGLYSWKSGDDPSMDQVWQGDIIEGEEIEITNSQTGRKMAAIHWANA
jgi:hypothetical protein